MKKNDLHLHTDCSDGKLSPSQLVELCAKKKYQTISITDHDTIEGYLAVKDKAKHYGITMIPGVEISTSYKGREVHILVYHFDENDPALLETLEYINNSRVNRAKKIISKLNKAGINLDFDYIFGKVGKSGIIGRKHIAREIMKIEKGVHINAIFDKYLNEKSSHFEPKITVSIPELIPIIRKAHGIAVLAHPHRLKNIALVHDIAALGIDGIEVYCAKSSTYHTNLFFRIAHQYNLLITGGSDFHCEPYEEAEFGSFSVPESCIKDLSNYKMICKGRNLIT